MPEPPYADATTRVILALASLVGFRVGYQWGRVLGAVRKGDTGTRSARKNLVVGATADGIIGLLGVNPVDVQLGFLYGYRHTKKFPG